MTIQKRAQAFIEKRTIPKQAHQLAAKCYINGSTEQRKIDIDKACEVYRNELEEIINLFNRIGKQFDVEDLGKTVALEGSVKDFRKAMEDEQ